MKQSHKSQRHCFSIKQKEMYATHHVESILYFETSFFEIFSLFFSSILRNQPSTKRTRKHLHCQYKQPLPDPNPHHSRTHPFKCHLGRDLEPVHSDGSAIWLTTQNIHLESSECYTATPYWDAHRLSPVHWSVFTTITITLRRTSCTYGRRQLQPTDAVFHGISDLCIMM